MTTPDKFKEYIWLINTIRRARRITLREINERWVTTDMSGGVEMARTTFNRHKDAIENIFGIYIECDRRNGYKYFIGNASVLNEDSVQNWMLSTLTVSNMLSESLSLQHRILLENIPSDGDHLQRVIEAMKQSRCIRINYRRYEAAEARDYDLEPYCAKLYRQRWYILGRFADGRFAIFAFDRIHRVQLLPGKFTMDRDFDAATYFAECFGVVVGDGTQAERIVLRAYGNERHYLQDLPLHHSQRVVGQGADYTDFALLMRPTSDFKGHLLSRGGWVKVVSPQWLADDICQRHRQAIEKYESE